MGLKLDNRQEKTAVGAFVLAGCRLLTKSLDLITLLVLARFLVQEDFGLVATALILVQIAEVALDIPVANIILRMKTVSRRHLDNLFTFAMARGFVVAVLMCLLAWPISLFFGDQRLVLLIGALSFAPGLRSLRSPREVMMARSLNYVPKAVADAYGKVASLLIATGLAIITGSYWAIVAGYVAAPLFSAAVSFALLPYMPRLDLKYWPLYRGFMGWSMGAQSLGAANWQSDKMVLGKTVSLAQLGIFSVARDLATNTIMPMVTTMLAPVLSALSGVSDDKRRLAGAYSRAVSAVLSIGLPVVIGQALLADLLVPLMLGSGWQESVLIFQIVSISLIFALFAYPATPLFYASGRPDLVFTRKLQDFLFRLPVTIVLALNFGLVGAAISLIVAEIFLVAICVHHLRKLTGLSIIQQLRLGERAIASSLVMAGAVLLVRSVAPQAHSALQQGAVIAQCAIIGGLAYVGVHYALWRMSGKPQGLEQMAESVIRRKLGRFFMRPRRPAGSTVPLHKPRQQPNPASAHRPHRSPQAARRHRGGAPANRHWR